MEKPWQHLDLRGGGVQGLNLRLAHDLKKRRVAYTLLLAFPLGLHRAYLDSRRGALAYVIASATAAALAIGGWPLAAGSLVAAIVVAALVDIPWIDRRLVALNKQIRLHAYLGQGATPPRGYSGRSFDDELQDYLHEKAAEAGGPEGGPRRSDQRRPTLAEQERMLRELARRKRDLP